MSRIAHQEFYLDTEEKNHLVRLIRRVERFSFLRVLAYCVMTNHLHILVYLLERPAARPSDDEMTACLAALYGETYALCVRGEWKRLDGIKPDGSLSAEDKEKYFARMYDVSEFMKAIKQRYSMSFNYENEHFGTMWEGRFKAVHVQPTMGPMAAVAAYDDLNPVRAGMETSPADYPWCSWYAALHGDELAREAYRFVYGMDGCEWEAVRAQHETVMREKAAFFAKASRSFIEGGAIGDEAFIRQYAKDYLPANRKSGPQKLAGGNVWGELRVAREVRAKGDEFVSGKGSDPMPESMGMDVVTGKGSDPIPEDRGFEDGSLGRAMVARARAAGPCARGWLDLTAVMGKGSDPLPESGRRDVVMGKGSDPLPESGRRDAVMGKGSDPMPEAGENGGAFGV